MKKRPQPKLERIPVEHEAYGILADMLEYHEGLQEAMIVLLWILEPKLRKGKRVLGTCQVLGEKVHRVSGADILIELDRIWWESADDSSKRYLVDHELSHARQKFMEVKTVTGEVQIVPARDAGDPPRFLYESVPHEIEDFAGPVGRWGPQPDLMRFLKEAQMPLPFGRAYDEDLVERIDEALADAN